MLPKKCSSNIFLHMNLFQRKKAKKVKANQLEIRSKGQLKLFRPTNLKRGQIFEVWPKRAYLATLISIYFYCWWVEDVSSQSPLVGPYIHTHIPT